MNIGHTTAPDRCPRCLRTKQEAIADHLLRHDMCDCQGCPFATEIRNALLEEQRKVRIKFGTVQKPTFTFSEHKEMPIKAVFRKICHTLKQFR